MPPRCPSTPRCAQFVTIAAQNCTVIQTNTVGRFCDLCICVIIVSLSIIASSFCQLVNNFFAVKILGEPHERIQTRVDVLVLDAIYQ
jgi:hypothetical protein